MPTIRVLSFDCATRSLAVCFMSITTDLNSVMSINHKKTDGGYIDVTDSSIDIHILKVFDLTDGIKINAVKRMSLLKECLRGVDLMVKESGVAPDHVLVEYQMPSNDKSRCVSTGIVYHYSGIPDTVVTLVGPTLKNKIRFSKDYSLSHGSFMERYASKYVANKNHCKSNFLYWLELHGLTNLIDENKITKKNVADIADAFMQIWGWLIFGVDTINTVLF
jgi:hypothetical protein